MTFFFGQQESNSWPKPVTKWSSGLHFFRLVPFTRRLSAFPRLVGFIFGHNSKTIEAAPQLPSLTPPNGPLGLLLPASLCSSPFFYSPTHCLAQNGWRPSTSSGFPPFRVSSFFRAIHVSHFFLPKSVYFACFVSYFKVLQDFAAVYLSIPRYFEAILGFFQPPSLFYIGVFFDLFCSFWAFFWGALSAITILDHC